METGAESLLMLCYPRSLSNVIVGIILRAMGGRLNGAPAPDHELLTAHSREFKQGWRCYARYDLHYRRCKALIDETCPPRGVLVKDVSAPYMWVRYLEEHPSRLNVLTIRRNLVDIVYRLLEKRWFWMTMARADTYAMFNEYRRKGIVDDEVSDQWVYEEMAGPLCRCALDLWVNVYSTIPQLDYEKLVVDPDYLFNTLRHMGYRVRAFDYVTPEFKTKRAQVQAYRQEDRWLSVQSEMQSQSTALGVNYWPGCEG